MDCIRRTDTQIEYDIIFYECPVRGSIIQAPQKVFINLIIINHHITFWLMPYPHTHTHQPIIYYLFMEQNIISFLPTVHHLLEWSGYFWSAPYDVSI